MNSSGHWPNYSEHVTDEGKEVCSLFAPTQPLDPETLLPTKPTCCYCMCRVRFQQEALPLVSHSNISGIHALLLSPCSVLFTVSWLVETLCICSRWTCFKGLCLSSVLISSHTPLCFHFHTDPTVVPSDVPAVCPPTTGVSPLHCLLTDLWCFIDGLKITGCSCVYIYHSVSIKRIKCCYSFN